MLAGKVKVAVCSKVLIDTDRASDEENSISLSIHQAPNVSDARGRHGPFLCHPAGAHGRLAIASSTSPSQRLVGPRPRLQLLIVSISTRLAAKEGTAPRRSAMARAAYKYWSAARCFLHFKAALRARMTRTVNGTSDRPKHAKYFVIVRSFDLLGLKKMQRKCH